jgi:CxxC motif-containing protein (DUF1111 family)
MAVAIGTGLMNCCLGLVTKAVAGSGPSLIDRVFVGRELFSREWVPNDPRCHGGDGLGLVYNASSCVACHHQGGPGGAGSANNNVSILTPLVDPNDENAPTGAELIRRVQSFTDLRTVGSFVFHRFGVNPSFSERRKRLVSSGAQARGFTMRESQRNTPALFGAGLIDGIPDQVLEAAEQRVFSGFPAVTGRVSRLAGGKIGRFGWKAQTASLEDFVLTACSVELGLEVPGHPQSIDPSHPDAKSPGLDLTKQECAALVAYVRNLPAPVRRVPLTQTQGEEDSAGRTVFESIGCATCHVPDLGYVRGLYSDLLLHDMGPALSDVAVYYGPPPASEPITEPGQLVDSQDGGRAAETRGATAQEWRTPPLWGLRDSGPYLHNGTATSLADVMRGHGGEATTSAELFEKLSLREKKQLSSFLLSLAAPPATRAGTTRGRIRHGRSTDREKIRFDAQPAPAPTGSFAIGGIGGSGLR